ASVTEGGAGLAGVVRDDVVGGVQAVFAIAAPIAALALVAVLALVEVPLKGAPKVPARRGPGEPHTPERMSAATSEAS
ncbi:MAG: hypothetical protein ACRDLA_02685, partial [Thermoleophilaceae bacterium]